MTQISSDQHIVIRRILLKDSERNQRGSGLIDWFGVEYTLTVVGLFAPFVGAAIIRKIARCNGIHQA